MKRTSILILISISIFVVVAGLLSFFWLVSLTSYNTIEHGEINNTLEYLQIGIQAQEHDIISKSRDYAWWDDTYKFIQGEYPGYPEDNFNTHSLNNLNIHLVAMLDTDQTVLFETGYEPQTDTLYPLMIPPDIIRSLITSEKNQTRTALYTQNSTPFLLCSVPILFTDISGPVGGTFIFGRKMDEVFLSQLQISLHHPVSIIVTPRHGDTISAYHFPDFSQVISNESDERIENSFTTITTDKKYQVSFIIDRPKNVAILGREIISGSLILIILVTAGCLILMTFILHTAFIRYEREKNEYLTTLVQFLPDATYAIDKDGTIIAWNQVMVQLSGKKTEEMIGTRDTTNLHALYGNNFPPLAGMLMRGDSEEIARHPSVHQRDNKLEAEISFASRDLGLFRIVAAPLYNSSGDIIGAIETLRNITERKIAEELAIKIETERELRQKNEELGAAYEELTAAEEELRANYEEHLATEQSLRDSEEKFKSLVEYALEPIGIINMQGTILFGNQALADLLDIYEINDIIGRNVMEFIAPESRDGVTQDFMQVAQGVDGFISEYQVVSAKGRRIFLESVGKIISYKGGTADLLSLHDITYRVQAEEELRVQNELINTAYHDLTLIEEQVRANYDELLIKEQEIRESEEMFRNPVEQSPVSIFLAQDGYFRYVNARLAQLLGHAREELLQIPVQELFSSQNGVDVKSLLSGMNTDLPSNACHQIQGYRADGSILELEMYAAGMQYQGSLATYGTIIDVTERRQIERARHQSEKMYRLITENMKDVVWIVDLLTWYPRYVSPSIFRLCGFTPEEAMQQRLFEMVNPELAENMKDLILPQLEEFNRSPENKIYYQSQYEQTCKDGSTVFTEVTYNFFINDETGNVEILGVSRDISATRRAEIEIEKKTLELYRKNEDLYAINEELTAIEEERRNAYEHLSQQQKQLAEHETSLRNAQAIAHLANWEWKPQSNHLYASDEFFRICGIESGQTPGYDELCTLIAPIDRERFRNLVKTIQTSGSAPSIDISIIRPDHTLRTVRVQGKAEFDDHATLTHFTLIILDITVQKQMEKDLIDANIEKEILLREIHHRVKNNMQVISSLLSLQSRTIQDQTVQHLFMETQNRVRSLSLVHEMLYKSESLNNINYRKYIQSLATYLLNSYHLTKGTVTFVIPEHEVQISIEKAVPCSLVITELITNSLKYAFPNGDRGEIRINFSYDEKSFEYVLEYQDTGRGFPPDLDPRKPSGFGSTLIQGLTRQLSGILTIERGDPGVHYRIVFPSGPIRD